MDDQKFNLHDKSTQLSPGIDSFWSVSNYKDSR